MVRIVAGNACQRIRLFVAFALVHLLNVTDNFLLGLADGLKVRAAIDNALSRSKIPDAFAGSCNVNDTLKVTLLANCLANLSG